LHQRLHQTTSSGAKTVALLVDHSEVKNKELECLSHLHSNNDFTADLALQKSVWITLKNGNRCLLMQNPKAKESDSSSDKAMYDLGKMAQLSLSARKISSVEVIASSKIQVTALPHFHKAFWLQNFEYSEKSHLDVEIKNTEDARSTRHSKVVDEMVLAHEDHQIDSTEFAYAKA
jgi:hypothetical protein